jgi:pimeloyl-ACP methyl ester carboxylesterase
MMHGTIRPLSQGRVVLLAALLILSLAILPAGCANSGSGGTNVSPMQGDSFSGGPLETSIGPGGGTAFHVTQGAVPAQSGQSGTSKDIEVEFPAGALSAATEVTLDDQQAPVTPANSLVLIAHSHTLKFPLQALKKRGTNDLLVHFPFSPEQNYRAAVGYCQNGVFMAFPATSDAAGVDGMVPIDISPDENVSSGTYSVEISLLEMPVMEEPANGPPMKVSRLEPDSQGSYKWSEYEGAWQGTKNSLLVHGICGSSADMLALAIHLKSTSNYDGIYAVDYPLGYHIDTLGTKLASIIGTHTPTGTKIDLLAHSMGGLVSRSAIENHGAAAQTARFISMGSPHSGVPGAFLLCLIAYNFLHYYYPEVTDLSPISDFLSRLNSGTKVNCTYFGAIGTDPTKLTTYFTVQWLGEYLVRFLIGGSFFADVDGMVPAKSAGYNISNKCQSWTTASFPVSHAYVRGGDQGQQIYADVFTQIDKWLMQ